MIHKIEDLSENMRQNLKILDLECKIKAKTLKSNSQIGIFIFKSTKKIIYF